MRWFVGLAVCLLVFAPFESSAASAPESEEASEEAEPSASGWGRVTVPGGSWFVALRLGRQDPADRDGSHLATQMDFGVGLSDRVELRPFWLSMRLGSPQTAEVLLEAGSKGVGAIGSDLVLVPVLGVQGILPVGSGQRLILGGQASTFATAAEPLAFFAGKWTGIVAGGWSLQIGDRLLFTPGLAVGADWGRSSPLYHRSARSRSTFVELGSVIPRGGSPLPLLSLRLADWVAIDGSASVRLDRDLPRLTQALGGFSLWF